LVLTKPVLSEDLKAGRKY